MNTNREEHTHDEKARARRRRRRGGAATCTRTKDGRRHGVTPSVLQTFHPKNAASKSCHEVCHYVKRYSCLFLLLNDVVLIAVPSNKQCQSLLSTKVLLPSPVSNLGKNQTKPILKWQQHLTSRRFLQTL